MIDRICANSIICEDLIHDGKPCWNWLGAKNNQGYGKISVRENGIKKTLLVHRFALKIFTGRNVRRKTVCKHLCNNKLCCNPDHLEFGTQKENIQQCVADGRHKTPFNKYANSM